MDKIYVPDYIPLTYKFAKFDEFGNMVLFEKEVYDTAGYYKSYTLYKNLQNKIITDVETIHVQEGQIYEVLGAHEIEVSHKWYDRPDCLNILLFSLTVIIATIWVSNIFTSIFRKGGLLSGLF